MTTGEYTPLLRNGSSRSATQHHIPINAHYYDITDIESWPVAGLLVLLDGQSQPVRAELHLYDDLEPHVQEAAIRQARLVLQERYVGGVPVPVRILDTLPVREEMLVRLPPLGARPLGHSLPRSLVMPKLPGRWRPQWIMGAGAVALIILIWVMLALLGRGEAKDDLAAITNTPESASKPSWQVVEAAPTTITLEAATTENVAASALLNGADLPVSRNARGDLGIGVRVQVVPGLRLALRSEPGADRGMVVGDMSEGEIATIVGGPEFTQGDSDTIVWWFVTLANSTQAWAPANTSQQTLLMPAELAPAGE
jgi:hypothetical protein